MQAHTAAVSLADAYGFSVYPMRIMRSPLAGNGGVGEARLEADDADAFAAATEDDADAGQWNAAHDATRAA